MPTTDKRPPGSVSISDVIEIDRCALALPIELIRYCSHCELERRFVAEFECRFGLVATCPHCGDEILAPFTRTTSEAA